MTDANVVLGRIVPRYFPHIFGALEDQPLDVAASKNAFEDLTKEVQNNSNCRQQLQTTAAAATTTWKN